VLRISHNVGTAGPLPWLSSRPQISVITITKPVGKSSMAANLGGRRAARPDLRMLSVVLYRRPIWTFAVAWAAIATA